MARSIGTTLIVSNGTKTMSYGSRSGEQIEKTAFHKGKTRNRTAVNIKKLLAKSHLVPIYEAREDTIFLIGYRRKASSRKAHQRPFLLPQPLALGKIDPNPETE
jgi:hypothetical protein